MKHESLVVLFTMLVIGLSSLMSYAQDEPKKYQGVIVWEDQVFPSKASAYEKAVKMQLENIAEHNFPHAINIFSASDYKYYWTIEIDNFADIDTVYKQFSKIYKNTGEETNKKIDDALAGTYEFSRPWTCVKHSDLSYVPEIQVEGDTDFRSWGFCYVKQGKGKEMREVFTKWVELYKSKGIERGFSFYVGDVGTEMPFMFWSISDKDQATFYNNDEKIREALGEEAGKLWEETEALLRKFENRTGWHRHDLSYKPSD